MDFINGKIYMSNCTKLIDMVKILIADDDQISLIMLDRALINTGYEVVKVSDGQAALEILKQEYPPQIAILDWNMPKMDGLEVVKIVRKSEKPIPLYIIMLTSHNSREYLMKSLEAGIDDYMIKPFQKYELIARVKLGIKRLKI